MNEQVATWVNPGLLQFLHARDPQAAAAVRRSQQIITGLLSFKWSIDDIVAAQTGYGAELHLASSNWRYAYDSRLLYEWLREHYQAMKAAKIGFSFEDFVQKWCQLSDKLNSLRWHNEQRYISSQEVMRNYVRARRIAALSDEEARSLVLFYSADAVELHIFLRARGLRQPFVTRVINERRDRIYTIPSKYIVEARKRGASEDQILASIADGSVRSLALGLRHPDN